MGTIDPTTGVLNCGGKGSGVPGPCPTGGAGEHLSTKAHELSLKASAGAGGSSHARAALRSSLVAHGLATGTRTDHGSLYQTPAHAAKAMHGHAADSHFEAGVIAKRKKKMGEAQAHFDAMRAHREAARAIQLPGS